jgi:hypothetical protein
LDQRNKQGYNVLLFRPPPSIGKKTKTVTLYGGLWHKLKHDSTSKKPYFRIARPDIHKFNRESLPSEGEQITESSDKEPPAPRPASEESSDEKPTQCLTSPTEQTTTPPATSETTDTYYRMEPPRLPSANAHHSSIATICQE